MIKTCAYCGEEKEGKKSLWESIPHGGRRHDICSSCFFYLKQVSIIVRSGKGAGWKLKLDPVGLKESLKAASKLMG